MPRFLVMLLGKFNPKVWIPIGILLAAGIGVGYNRGESNHPDGVNASNLETFGVAPHRAAGVLSQVGKNDLEIVGLRNTVDELRAEIHQLKTKKPPVVAKNPCTDKIRAELEGMRALLMANASTAKPAPASPPPPEEPKSRARRITPSTAHKDDASKESKPRVKVKPPGDTHSSVRSDRVPYLPPQSIAEGRTIDGYTALAVEGEFDLTLEITTPFNLPDGSQFPVSNCRLGALGLAEELTARSRLALTQMTCVVDGQVIEAPIEGYITARDNINGLIAEVFWHEREVLEAFGKAAVPAALVSLFEETRRVVEVASLTGVLTSTGSGVAEETAGRMVDIYLDKAEKLSSPVVWVPDNRYVNIYITKGASLKGLDTRRVAKRSFHEEFSR